MLMHPSLTEYQVYFGVSFEPKKSMKHCKAVLKTCILQIRYYVTRSIFDTSLCYMADYFVAAHSSSLQAEDTSTQPSPFSKFHINNISTDDKPMAYILSHDTHLLRVTRHAES